MAIRNYSSVAPETTLQSGINNVSTVILVASTVGFPAAPFTLALDYGAPTEELVDVTGVAGLSLTVTRAVDGTSATSHGAGAKVRHVSSARDFREANEHVNATTNVHGLAGGAAVVGTTSAQTLFNKTLSAPVLTGAVNSSGATFDTLFPNDYIQTTPSNGSGFEDFKIQDSLNVKQFSVTDTGNVFIRGNLDLQGVGGFRTAFKSANTSRASTTVLAADPHLTFASLPVGRYLLDGQFFVDTNTGDGDIKFDIQGSAVGTVAWGSAGGFITPSGVTSGPGEWRSSSHTLAAAGSIAYMTSTSASSPTVVSVGANINVTTTGSVSILWAQNTSNAIATVLLADSWVRLQRIA